MSECKTAWKYLKGSEKDFEGAPEWATLKTKSFNNYYFVERHENKARYKNTEWDYESRINNGVDTEFRTEIIAQREPITNVTVNISTPCGEDDLNECIGSTESLIAERGARYGKFKDGAEIMRDLKHVMHEVDGWNNLTPSQKEALDMIQHKIGRILNGDPNYDDNWKDIAGYAKLIADEPNGEEK